MAASKALQFFLLISFMIFSTCTGYLDLEVILTNGLCKDNMTNSNQKCFWFDPTIKIGFENGNRCFVGCTLYNQFRPPLGTTKVIVYIDDKSTMEKILNGKNLKRRKSLAKKLWKHKYQLLYLSVDGIQEEDGRVMAEFISFSIYHSGHYVADSTDRPAIDINGIEIIQGENLNPKYLLEMETNHLFSEFENEHLEFNLAQRIRKMGSVGNQEGLKEKSVMWIQKLCALGLPKQNRGSTSQHN